MPREGQQLIGSASYNVTTMHASFYHTYERTTVVLVDGFSAIAFYHRFHSII
jgi:hypothetical protein